MSYPEASLMVLQDAENQTCLYFSDPNHCLNRIINLSRSLLDQYVHVGEQNKELAGVPQVSPKIQAHLKESRDEPSK